MHDSELKKLLLDTCPIRPGQEKRAWTSLRNRLYAPAAPSSPWAWLFYPTWRGAVVGFAAIATLAVLGNLAAIGSAPFSLATADSQSPGIYATAFYSKSARAQVVWLNGLEPATDKPTYLDPTTVIARDPNSL